MMKRLKLVCACAAVASLQQAIAESTVVPEYPVTEDVEIRVESGDVKRIEYLSGTATATITKTGGGTLEIGVLGNENFSFVVQEGSLKPVLPAFILPKEAVTARFDASDVSSMAIDVQKGTNYVTQWNDADGRTPNLTRYSTRPYPYLNAKSLNGLQTVDFGPMRSTALEVNDGYGASFQLDAKLLPNEVYYVWIDDEAAKDKTSTSGEEFNGPMPLTAAGWYRGKGGNGNGFKLFGTVPDKIGLSCYLDDVKASKDYVAGEGAHLLRWKCATPFAETSRNDYGATWMGYRSNMATTPYGGFRMAECIICETQLTEAQSEYVRLYLKGKWFGATKASFVCVAAGATFDTSGWSWTVNRFCAERGSDIVNAEQLHALEISGTNEIVVTVNGTFHAVDRLQSATPSLSFADEGEIAVASGTARGDVVDAQGTVIKSGAGTLELSYLSERVTGLSVTGGSLVLSPLLSAASALHFDATTNVTTEVSGDVNQVTGWGDVNEGRGSELLPSKFNYKFKSEKIHKPFLAERAAGTLPMVDFGGLVDYGHTNGNLGAGLDFTRGLNGGGNKDPSIFLKADGWQQAFVIWDDDDGAKDLDLVNGAEFTGPCMFGVSYMWTRGKGGGGNGFPLCGADSAAFRQNLFLDGVQILPADCKTYRVPDGLHLYDSRPGLADGLLGVTTAGYREQTKEAAVYGGVKFGEFMFFRHRLPEGQRAKIAAALGVKWFGTDKWKLEQVFGSLAVADGASASFPYADVTVTNLTASGSVSARSLTVAAGGKLIVDATDRVLTADGVSFAGKGTIVLNADVGPTIDEPIKVIAAANGPATPRKVPGWRTKTGVKAVLVRRADGYYLDPAPGLVLILK